VQSALLEAMQERQVSIGSACMLAGTMAAESAADNENQYTCKITVLKKTINEDWNKEYRNFEGVKCNAFEVGQEFIVESPWSAPEGFCHWAWADIRSFIHLVNEGKFGTFVSCCTDGFRPVFFKIERIKH
ncbi:TIGR04076 family protein, partial [Bacteroidota bacterium]